MPERGEGADARKGQPQMCIIQALPEQRQSQRGHDQTHHAGVEVRGPRIVVLGQCARHQLEYRSGHDQGEWQQHGPLEGLAAGANHDDGARKAAQHQQPAQHRDLLLHQFCRKQGNEQGIEHHDGGELGHRDAHQAQHRKGAAQQQQQAAHHLQAGDLYKVRSSNSIVRFSLSIRVYVIESPLKLTVQL